MPWKALMLAAGVAAPLGWYAAQPETGAWDLPPVAVAYAVLLGAALAGPWQPNGRRG